MGVVDTFGLNHLHNMETIITKEYFTSIIYKIMKRAVFQVTRKMVKHLELSGILAASVYISSVKSLANETRNGFDFRLIYSITNSVKIEKETAIVYYFKLIHHGTHCFNRPRERGVKKNTT